MSENRSSKKSRTLLIILIISGACITAAAMIFFSKIKGDETVLKDIDRHFDAHTQSLPANLDNGTSLQIAGSPITPRQNEPNATASDTVSPKHRQAKRRARRRQKNSPSPQLPSRASWPGIRGVGPATFEIHETLAEEVRSSPMKFVPGVTAHIAEVNGKPAGFRLRGIRSKSALFVLGLRNNDILTAVNGFSLKTIDEALLAAGAAKFADKLRVDILRNGRKKSIYCRVSTF